MTKMYRVIRTLEYTGTLSRLHQILNNSAARPAFAVDNCLIKELGSTEPVLIGRTDDPLFMQQMQLPISYPTSGFIDDSDGYVDDKDETL